MEITAHFEKTPTAMEFRIVDGSGKLLKEFSLTNKELEASSGPPMDLVRPYFSEAVSGITDEQITAAMRGALAEHTLPAKASHP